ncbi:superoxide dismutase [Cu-Zn] [Aplysia californica]|uniref:Superoxide dismutase [Cu-Zn] n=1 Tax=Aplysia californica TaxID=6500 RepID=A0ABM0JMJ3_APLCA|nr:superoxide dismutase [Cu-Zn] [Aplysia californica]
MGMTGMQYAIVLMVTLWFAVSTADHSADHTAGNDTSSSNDTSTAVSTESDNSHNSPVLFGTCYMQPNPNYAGDEAVTGIVNFHQRRRLPLDVFVRLSGFNTSASLRRHGIVVHQQGDISGGCESSGPHYNPSNSTHGYREDHARHEGDLGNIDVDQGQVDTNFTVKGVSLFGKYSIIGRTLVVHVNEDDGGSGLDPQSAVTGNVGACMACCVIGRLD